MLCSRVSYSQERHLFHIVVRDGITFLCMADEVRCLLCNDLLMTGNKGLTYLGLLSPGWCMPNPQCSQLARLQNPVHPQEFGRRIPFAFLEDVREKYMAKFGDAAQSAPAYAHNGEFSQVHLSSLHLQDFQLVQSSSPSFDMQCHMPLCGCVAVADTCLQFIGAGGAHGVL